LAPVAASSASVTPAKSAECRLIKASQVKGRLSSRCKFFG
jgi:hypothetical protein